MINKKNLHIVLTLLISGVWIVNGLFCKILNFVPRHREIVGSILGKENALIFNNIIGVSEIFMALWIISGYKSRLNAVAQIVIILMMNIIEFAFVPHLLFWGRMNILFAVLFSAIIYFNEFNLKKP